MLQWALRTLIVIEGKVWAKTVLAKNEVAARAAEIVLNVFMVDSQSRKLITVVAQQGVWLKSKGKALLPQIRA